jgi:hypothetical protein
MGAFAPIIHLNRRSISTGFLLQYGTVASDHNMMG